MAEQDNEYISSIQLLILGENLEPDLVSKELNITPTKTWRKGELKFDVRKDGTTKFFKTRYKWGGWKLSLPTNSNEWEIETQIDAWIKHLRHHADTISRLKANGFECYLDVFIATDETASMIISPEMIKNIGLLGLEVRISIWATKEDP